MGSPSYTRADGLAWSRGGVRSGRSLARDFVRVLEPVQAMARGYRWTAVALAAGVLPLVAAFGLGLDVHRPLAALILFPLWVLLVRDDREASACGMVFLAFAVHSVCAMALVGLDPLGADRVLLDGPAYWSKNIHWIRTGQDPEYQVAYWVPAHLQDAAGMALYGITSLGFVPLVRGLYQMDLMNCYVGHLLAVSRSGVVSVVVGWHVWSVLRGVAYTRLCFEASSLGLQWMTGVPLSTRPRRRRRWAVAVALLLADGMLKWLLLEPVRRTLADNLVH